MMSILFICTGNTCRSPMAEALLKEELRQAGIDENQISVHSAGIYAAEGEKATPQAVQVMEERSIPLKDHLSRRLTPRCINEAHLILGMTEAHRDAVLMVDAAAADRVFSLPEYVAEPGETQWQDVPDPYGQALAVYRRTADNLQVMIRKLMEKLKQERMVEGP